MANLASEIVDGVEMGPVDLFIYELRFFLMALPDILLIPQEILKDTVGILKGVRPKVHV